MQAFSAGVVTAGSHAVESFNPPLPKAESKVTETPFYLVLANYLAAV